MGSGCVRFPSLRKGQPLTQTQLNRAVARATGDDVAVIAAHGFSLLEDEFPAVDDDQELLMLMEWDALNSRQITNSDSGVTLGCGR
jgi:hypothetical protein